MKKTESDNIIKLKKVPSDELDVDKYWGYSPAVGIMLAFGIPLLPFVKDSVTLFTKVVGFIIGVLLFTYFQFKNEKRLKSIRTNLAKEYNEILITEYLKKRNISFEKYKYYMVIFLPALIYNKGLKTIFLYDEGNIYFNIRRIGFEGRIPFSIGRLLEEKRLIREFKKHSK